MNFNVQMGGGGGFDGPPGVFDMLQYFETILPSVESLWSSLQDEEHFMDGGAAWCLWLQQILAAILDFVMN